MTDTKFCSCYGGGYLSPKMVREGVAVAVCPKCQTSREYSVSVDRISRPSKSKIGTFPVVLAWPLYLTSYTPIQK